MGLGSKSKGTDREGSMGKSLKQVVARPAKMRAIVCKGGYVGHYIGEHYRGHQGRY